MLADRFGGPPFVYWHADAQERELLLELLGVEAEVSRVFAGMGAGDDVVYVDDDSDGYGE
jgi:hypothetical protein